MASDSTPSILRLLFSPRMVLCLLLGFSSGFPYAAIESTLQAWLTDEKLDLDTIAQFGWVLLPYSLKYVWAPFLDRYSLPILGRRRGWAVVSQIGMAISFGAMALCKPHEAPMLLAIAATCVAFFSASQDIALDAQRRELFASKELGLASTFFTNGYRIGLIFSGFAALYIASYYPWWVVYVALAVASVLCSCIVLVSPEPKAPERNENAPISEVIFSPFIEFFKRREAIELLAFVLLYKIGDSMAAALRTKFLLDVGYSKIDIADISKLVGLWASIAGAFVGGIAMLRMGLFRSLFWFGIFQAVSTLGFWFIAEMAPDRYLLALVIFLENFTGGMGTSAYVAFVASICDPRFSGTQYAGLTSLMRIPSLIVSTQTGKVVAILGWSKFFIVCVVAALPAFFLMPRIGRYIDRKGRAISEPGEA